MVRTVGESLRALLLICVVSFFVKLAADFVLFGRMHADLRWYANASITAAVLALVYFWSRYRLRAAYARLLAYEDGRRVRNHAIRNHLNVIACLVPENEEVLRELACVKRILDEPPIENALQREAERLKFEVRIV